MTARSVKLLQQAAALQQRGDHVAAEALCRVVLRIDPHEPNALHLLGIIALQRGEADEAVRLINEALTAAPRQPLLLTNLGAAQRAAGQPEAALRSFERAIGLHPGHAEAFNGRGLALAQLGRYREALACHDRVIALRLSQTGAAYPGDPIYRAAQNNRGNALAALNRHDEALACYDDLITLCPDWAEPVNNRAILLLQLGRHDGALTGFDHAVTLRPDYADAHVNRSQTRLALGDFAAGWPEYEWRWKLPRLRRTMRSFPQDRWRGQHDIAGRTVLLHAEQGLGDTIQFCRYVPQVAELAHVVLEVPASLHRLLRTLDGGALIVARGDALPPFDLHAPLLSLPEAYGTTVTTIPNKLPYLRADAAEVSAWNARLAALPGLHVGLVWAGSPWTTDPVAASIDRRRSTTLAQFAPLAALGGITWVSLQKGPPASQARTPPAGMTLHDWTDELHDFAATAALVAALDLVICVDTSVIHLAGALGKPVWVLNRFDACWRWLCGRDDSPWYPTARLFRQPAPADWRGVVAMVGEALRIWLATRHGA